MTRPTGEGADSASFIRTLGWTPLIFHTVELKPRPRSEVLPEFKEAVSKGPPEWFVFMSPRGVGLLSEMLKNQGDTLTRVFGQSRVLAVGPTTRSSLVQASIKKVEMPEDYSSDGAADFLSKTPLQGKRVILARSSQGSETLRRRLKAKGALVKTIRLYDSSVPADRKSVSKFLAQLRSRRIHATLFTSALSATNLFNMSRPNFSPKELRALLKNCTVAAIGPATADRLKKLGVNPTLMPKRYLIDSAITSLVETVEKKESILP